MVAPNEYEFSEYGIFSIRPPDKVFAGNWILATGS
jgi:hypothetical protein